MKNLKIKISLILNIVLICIIVALCIKANIFTSLVRKTNDYNYLSNKKYTEKYELFNSYPINSEIKEGGVVFVGDSLTERCNWNDLLGEENIYNRGIGGDVTEGILNRLESITRLNPKKIVIMAGINDIYNGVNLENIKSNYIQIIKELKNKLPNSQIYVTSTLPMTKNTFNKLDSVLELNKFLFVEKINYSYEYIDLYPSLIDSEGYLDESYTVDGTHLLDNGYTIYRNLLTKTIYTTSEQ